MTLDKRIKQAAIKSEMDLIVEELRHYADRLEAVANDPEVNQPDTALLWGCVSRNHKKLRKMADELEKKSVPHKE